MKLHSANFKNGIKLQGREIDCKIIIGDTVLGAEELNTVTPSFQTSLLKSVMKQLNIDSNIEIPLNSILRCEFGIKVNSEYEYIDFGSYVVYKSDKQEDLKSYKIICYDKMLYTMKSYTTLQNGTFPMTVREYIKNLCLDCGLVFKNTNDTFVNYDKIIESDLYANLGYTYRDIFDQLSEVTASNICIDNDDQVEVRYITETGDVIDEEFLKDTNVNFGEKFGKVNSIVLSRSAESDNVYLQDETSIAMNGLCEIKIVDNQIMNFNNRSDFLPDILEKLNGLEFYLNDFESTGICYYDVCDQYGVQIGDNVYSCVMFDDEILITQGLSENIFTERPKENSTDYTKADKTDRKINQTNLIVDKQNKKIEALVKDVEEIELKTLYTWIKYADDENGTNISDDPDGKAYIGIAYNKTEQTASNNPSDYTWSKIQGEKGEQGLKGDKGEKGETGASGKDAEPPKSIDEASGTELTVEASQYNAKEFKVYGNSEQETSTQSANIFAMTNKTFRTKSSYITEYTITNYNDVTIKSTGGATYQTLTFNLPSSLLEVGATYYIGGIVESFTSPSSGIILGINEIELSTGKRTLWKECWYGSSDLNKNKSNSITIKDTTLYRYDIRFYPTTDVGGTTNDAIEVVYKNVYVSKTNQYVDFVPDMPSPDYPSEVETVDGITNLIDKNNLLVGYVQNSDTGELLSNNNFTCTNELIEVEPNKTYIFSGDSTITRVMRTEYDNSKKFNSALSRVESKNADPFTTKETTKYIRVAYNSSTIKEVQLEKSPVPHSYVPYGTWLPVKITGKNIFDISNNPIVVGVHYDNSGNLLNWANYIGIKDYVPVQPNQTYIQSNNLGLNISGLVFYDKNKNFISRIINQNIFTTPNNAYFIKFSMYSDGNIIPTWVQIELGSEVTNNEDYQETTTLIDMNKPNLFDKNNSKLLSAYFYGTGGIISNTATKVLYIPCQPNTYYTVEKIKSSRFTVGTTTDIPAVGSAINDFKQNNDATKLTTKTSTNAKYLCVFYYHSSHDTLTEQEILDSIKIYEGSSVGNNYELCKIGDVRDELTIVDGQVQITKRIGKVVLDGSESGWSIYEYTASGVTNYYNNSLIKFKTQQGISDRFAVSTDTNMNNAETRLVMFNTLVGFGIFGLSSIFGGLTEFKTWLSNNNVTVYYILAEEEVITLPDANVPLFEGINHISLEDDLKTDLYIKYYTNFKGNGTAVQSATEPTDKSQMWLDTNTNELKAWDGSNWVVINDFSDDLDILEGQVTQVVSQVSKLEETSQGITATVTKQEETIKILDGAIQTLDTTITQMSASFTTLGLTINKLGDNFSSTLDNRGLRIFNLEKLTAIFNKNGSGVEKLIAIESIQLQHLLLKKATKETQRHGNIPVISGYWQDVSIKELKDLDTEEV